MRRSSTDYIVVHCTATPPDRYVDAKEINHWHIQRGFAGIGYHYVIQRDGTIEIGRKSDQIGAHAQGHNDSSVAVCLVGGIDKNGKPESNYTPEQAEMLHLLIDGLRARYPAAEVLGHCDLPGVAKACPCFDVRRWFDGLCEIG